MSKRTFYFSAFRYVVPSDYEKWFEDLAADGWHPQKVGQWNSLIMHFIKGEPRKYRYVVDMQSLPGKDYKQTYEEFGWEYVGQMASAVVWRREYQNERPESFTDSESLRARNKRFLGAVSVSFALFLLGVLGSLAGLIFGSNDTIDRIQFVIAAVLCLAAAVALAVVMNKIRRNLDK